MLLATPGTPTPNSNSPPTWGPAARNRGITFLKPKTARMVFTKGFQVYRRAKRSAAKETPTRYTTGRIRRQIKVLLFSYDRSEDQKYSRPNKWNLSSWKTFSNNDVTFWCRRPMSVLVVKRVNTIFRNRRLLCSQHTSVAELEGWCLGAKNSCVCFARKCNPFSKCYYACKARFEPLEVNSPRQSGTSNC